jgi:putative peptidoglycan lipid II flippase
MSAYSVANNIPNMIFELVAGGILSSLFIPTFLELRNERGDEAAWRFASHVFNIFVLALGAVALLGTLFPEPFILTQTFRMTAEKAAEIRGPASFFFRFFAIQVVLYGAGMVFQGLLNAQRRYLWTALGPVFNNIVVIATLVLVAFLGAESGVGRIVLAVGTTLGVVAMFGVMVPSMVKSGVRYTPELGLRDPAVRRMLLLALPTLVYVATNLVAVSFRNASALAVTPRGAGILIYAWTFYQLPYGIMAVALATAVFTELADAAGRKDMAAFKQYVLRGLGTTGVLMLPMAALLFALAEPLVGLYRIGHFTASDVAPVSIALRGWAVSLVFYASAMFLLRTFYSLKDTRTPMLVNLVLTPVIQIGLYIVLTTGVGAWHGIGLLGIPLADAAFYAAISLVLALLLRRRIGGYDMRAMASSFARVTVAAAVGGAVAWGLSNLLAPVSPNFVASLAQVAVGGTGGLLVAYLLARVMRVREADDLNRLVRRAASRLAPSRREQ